LRANGRCDGDSSSRAARGAREGDGRGRGVMEWGVCRDAI